MSRNKYGNWNKASYYPNVHLINRRLHTWSIEKMLNEPEMKLCTTSCYYNKRNKLNDFEISIIIRVGASNGLTKKQLKNYMLLQGIEVIDKVLNKDLYYLVKFGYLNLTKIQNRFCQNSIKLYTVSRLGIRKLKELGVPYNDSTADFPADNDVLKHIIKKIVINQIVQNLLYYNKNIKFFNCFTPFSIISRHNYVSDFIIPLVVKTEQNTYVFEFAEGKSTAIFQKRVEKFIQEQILMDRNLSLVIIAENKEDILDWMVQIDRYKKKGLLIDVLYTYCDIWSYEVSGIIYKNKITMGKTKLIQTELV